MEPSPSVRKKLVLHSEPVYLLANIFMALAVSMSAAADFGLSMIVSPAFIVSQKFPVLTFGQAEYVVQGLLFIVFCLLMKRVKITYFASFLTGLFYGAVLDAWRWLVPLFNPAVTAPDSLAWWVRGLLFVGGMVLTSFAVALFFKVYLPPMVYDFFVKGISAHFRIDRTKFKRLFDAGCLAVGVAMTLIFFRQFVGIGWGTLVITAINGLLIGWFDRILDKFVEFRPLLPQFARYFELD